MVCKSGKVRSPKTGKCIKKSRKSPKRKSPKRKSPRRRSRKQSSPIYRSLHLRAPNNRYVYQNGRYYMNPEFRSYSPFVPMGGPGGAPMGGPGGGPMGGPGGGPMGGPMGDPISKVVSAATGAVSGLASIVSNPQNPGRRPLPTVPEVYSVASTPMSGINTAGVRSPRSPYMGRAMGLIAHRPRGVNPSAATSPEGIVGTLARTPQTLVAAVTSPIRLVGEPRAANNGILGAVSGAIGAVGSAIGSALNFSPTGSPVALEDAYARGAGGSLYGF